MAEDASPSPAPAAVLPDVPPLGGGVDWNGPRALALRSAWVALQPAVAATATKAMLRCQLTRPGSDVAKHDARGKREVKRADGTVWQQSIDETVLWTQEHGEWQLVLPWQVLNKVRRIEHTPQIAVARPAHEDGGLSEEERIAAKLKEVAGRLKALLETGRGVPQFGDPTIRRIWGLAAQYLNMPVQGRKGTHEATGCRHSFYYTWESLPLEVKEGSNQECRSDWEERLGQAQALHDHELVWVCQMFLKGRPVRISNFYIEPLHSLLKADGKTYLRVFRLHTATRTVPYGPLEMTGDDYHSPSYLRRWLNSHAGGVWHAGEKDLQLVIEDCSLVFDQEEVQEIAVIGFHEESGAWFTHTAAVDCRGEVRTPDRKSGVFKVPVARKDGNGFTWKKYRLSERDKDDFGFALGRVDWKPEWHLRAGALTPWEQEHGHRLFDPAQVRRDFATLAWRAHDMVGGWNAYLGLGWVFSCLAAPEVFAKHRAFPGYWIHGEVKQGKSTWAEVLMRCLGYPCAPSGVSLESSTAAGGETVMQQYSQLPAWFEEAQGTIKETLMALLKAGFNRQPPQKRVANLREVLCSPLVVGISTCGDAQIRSRYPHQLVSVQTRLPLTGDAREEGGGFYSAVEAKELQDANFDWISAHKEEFVLFGRLVLENRKRFADRLMDVLGEWLRAPDTSQLDARAKLVHGICYASWVTLTELFGLQEMRFRTAVTLDGEEVRGQQWGPTATVLKQFRRFVVDASRIAAADVAEAAELDQFFKTLVTGFALGWFGQSKSEWTTFFRVEPSDRTATHAPGTLPEAEQNQGYHRVWQSYRLLLWPDRVCMAMRENLRKSGSVMPLREDELRRQMAVKPYWVATTAQKRFGVTSADRTRKHWTLELDAAGEWGYRPLPDDDPELQAWLGQGMSADPWKDPRREGGLYQIVKAIVMAGAET